MLDRIVTAFVSPMLASFEALLLRSPSLALVVISAVLFSLAALIQERPKKTRPSLAQPDGVTGKVEETPS